MIVKNLVLAALLTLGNRILNNNWDNSKNPIELRLLSNSGCNALLNFISLGVLTNIEKVYGARDGLYIIAGASLAQSSVSLINNKVKERHYLNNELSEAISTVLLFSINFATVYVSNQR